MARNSSASPLQTPLTAEMTGDHCGTRAKESGKGAMCGREKERNNWDVQTVKGRGTEGNRQRESPVPSMAFRPDREDGRERWGLRC